MSTSESLSPLSGPVLNESFSKSSLYAGVNVFQKPKAGFGFLSNSDFLSLTLFAVYLTNLSASAIWFIWTTSLLRTSGSLGLTSYSPSISLSSYGVTFSFPLIRLSRPSRSFISACSRTIFLLDYIRSYKLNFSISLSDSSVSIILDR